MSASRGRHPIPRAVVEYLERKGRSDSISFNIFSTEIEGKLWRPELNLGEVVEENRVVSSRAPKPIARLKFGCHSSVNQQQHQRTPPSQKIDKHLQHRLNTQIRALIYPHQRTNIAVAFAISYRPILANSLGLLHEPARRVTIYI
jgi:hypothetical protein